MLIAITESNFLQQLPNAPGVYRFYGEIDKISQRSILLYVGKAVDLQKRIMAYFRKTSNLAPRIRLMVAQIASIEVVITDNETSALILESNFIKNLKPKYNVILNDDKSYPILCLSKKEFPRLVAQRSAKHNIHINDYQIFGPYPNSRIVKHTIDLLQKLFKLRTCSDEQFAKRQSPCLLYSIKRCSAPCVNYINREQYDNDVRLAVNFLNGAHDEVIQTMTKAMFNCAATLKFEQAVQYRDKIFVLRQLAKKQALNKQDQPVNIDILYCQESAAKIFIYVIIVRGGVMVGDNHFMIDYCDNLAHSIEEFLVSYCIQFPNSTDLQLNVDLNRKVIATFYNAFAIKITTKLNNPALKQLYSLAGVNLTQIISHSEHSDQTKLAAILLAKLLNMPPIKRIEGLDISHHHGASTVASLVVYADDMLQKKLYRFYNLSATIAGNDLQAMIAALTRRLNKNNTVLPELMIIDGGHLQLRAIKNLLKEVDLCGKIRLIALCKGQARKEIFDKAIIDDGRVLQFADNKVLFSLLQLVRDAAHNFALKKHRRQQIKQMTASALDQLPNIGKNRKLALLAAFGSVKEIARAGIADLQQVAGIGPKLALIIYEYFHNK